MLRFILVLNLLFTPFICFANTFELTSSDLMTDGFTAKFVSNQFGCEGENISPSLLWYNAPAETKSFVLMMYDPDAPTGSGWWHWVIANIPMQTKSIAQSAGNHPNLLPKGSKLVRNDFGVGNYGGPCPPLGTNHRYQFTLYALDIDHIDINDKTSSALIGFMANAHMLAKATMTYHYAR